MLRKFDSLVFFVQDIHLVSKWYADLLDSDVQYENDQYAFILFIGGKLGFHPDDMESSGDTASQTVYWEVDSLSASIEKLKSKGAKLTRGPLKTTLNEHACIICDPFGNRLGLISKNT